MGALGQGRGSEVLRAQKAVFEGWVPLKGAPPTSSNMFKSIAPLLVLSCSLWSCPTWGQEETRSVGEHPWALSAQIAPDFGNGFSGVSAAMERRLIGSPDKFHQVGVRFGAQHLNVDFFGVTRGTGMCGGAFLLLGQTHFLDLQAGGALVYDRSSESSAIYGVGGGNDGHTGWASWPVLSAGYRYVSPGPERGMIKVGIGTLGVYVGFGFVLK